MLLWWVRSHPGVQFSQGVALRVLRSLDGTNPRNGSLMEEVVREMVLAMMVRVTGGGGVGLVSCWW